MFNKTIKINLIILATLFLFSGCDSILKEKKINDEQGIFEFTVPALWMSGEKLNDQAQINLSNTLKNAYIILIAENKMDFADMDLSTHSEITLSTIENNLTNAKISDKTEFTINGYDAIQYQVEGMVNNLNAVYIHRTVETNKYFNQILAWSLKSKFESLKPEIIKIIDSFLEKDDIRTDS